MSADVEIRRIYLEFVKNARIEIMEDEKIKVGLVGYGYWGPNVAKSIYANKNLKLIKICDKNKARIDVAKGIYVKSCEYTENYEELIEDENVDVIAIAVETESHYSLAKIALEAGKDIYIEKPFTSSIHLSE